MATSRQKRSAAKSAQRADKERYPAFTNPVKFKVGACVLPIGVLWSDWERNYARDQSEHGLTVLDAPGAEKSAILPATRDLFHTLQRGHDASLGCSKVYPVTTEAQYIRLMDEKVRKLDSLIHRAETTGAEVDQIRLDVWKTDHCDKDGTPTPVQYEIITGNRRFAAHAEAMTLRVIDYQKEHNLPEPSYRDVTLPMWNCDVIDLSDLSGKDLEVALTRHQVLENELNSEGRDKMSLASLISCAFRILDHQKLTTGNARQADLEEFSKNRKQQMFGIWCFERRCGTKLNLHKRLLLDSNDPEYIPIGRVHFNGVNALFREYDKGEKNFQYVQDFFAGRIKQEGSKQVMNRGKVKDRFDCENNPIVKHTLAAVLNNDSTYMDKLACLADASDSLVIIKDTFGYDSDQLAAVTQFLTKAVNAACSADGGAAFDDLMEQANAIEVEIVKSEVEEEVAVA